MSIYTVACIYLVAHTTLFSTHSLLQQGQAREMIDRLRAKDQQQPRDDHDRHPVTEAHVEQAHHDYEAAAAQLKEEHEQRLLREKQRAYETSMASPTTTTTTTNPQDDFGYVHKETPPTIDNEEEQLKQALKQQQQQQAASRIPRSNSRNPESNNNNDNNDLEDRPVPPSMRARHNHDNSARNQREGSCEATGSRTSRIGSVGFGAPDGDDQTARMYNGERLAPVQRPTVGAAAANAAARMRPSRNKNAGVQEPLSKAPPAAPASAQKGARGQQFVQEDIMGVQSSNNNIGLGSTELVGYGAPDGDRAARINDGGRATHMQAAPYKARRQQNPQEYHQDRHNRVYRKLRQQAGPASSSSPPRAARSAMTTTAAEYHRQHQTVNHDTYSQSPLTRGQEQQRREERLPPGHQRRNQRIDSENHSFANKAPAPAEQQRIYQAKVARKSVPSARKSSAPTNHGPKQAPSALNDPSFNLGNINQYEDYKGEADEAPSQRQQQRVRARDYVNDDDHLGEDASALHSRHGHLNTDVSFNMQQFNN